MDITVFMRDGPYDLLPIDMVNIDILLIVDDHVVTPGVRIDHSVEVFFIQFRENACSAEDLCLVAVIFVIQD